AADLLAGETQLLDQRGASARLLDRVEVLTGHVLDQRRFDRGGILALAHQRRNAIEAGQAGRAPAALPGDELVGATRPGAHEHGLEDPLLTEGAGQRLKRLGVE